MILKKTRDKKDNKIILIKLTMCNRRSLNINQINLKINFLSRIKNYYKIPQVVKL